MLHLKYCTQTGPLIHGHSCVTQPGLSFDTDMYMTVEHYAVHPDLAILQQALFGVISCVGIKGVDLYYTAFNDELTLKCLLEMQCSRVLKLI